MYYMYFNFHLKYFDADDFLFIKNIFIYPQTAPFLNT